MKSGAPELLKTPWAGRVIKTSVVMTRRNKKKRKSLGIPASSRMESHQDIRPAPGLPPQSSPRSQGESLPTYGHQPSSSWEAEWPPVPLPGQPASTE